MPNFEDNFEKDSTANRLNQNMDQVKVWKLTAAVLLANLEDRLDMAEQRITDIALDVARLSEDALEACRLVQD